MVVFLSHSPLHPRAFEFQTALISSSSRAHFNEIDINLISNLSMAKNNKGRNTKIPKSIKQEEEIADMEDLFSEGDTRKIRASLLDWYDENQRDLPWRRRATTKYGNGKDVKEEEEEDEKRAYEFWVSEVMLQQTRVQAVIGNYNRWMQKWPTLQHLSQASLEEVNEMWAGLGYYRRSRFLLEGAKMIVSGGSEFPNTVSALRKVPGIGDYTAGAIASIAFKQVVPVVDGNVVRVLARLKAISANPKEKHTVKNFWKLAAQLVDPLRPGDFNQSLMELGATLCTPLNPNCTTCPVSSQCSALRNSRNDESVMVTDYPMKVVKAKQRNDFSTVCVVEISAASQDRSQQSKSDSRFLLVKRPDEGLLAGLWEFPCVTLDEEADLSMRRKLIDQLLKKSVRLDPPKNCSIISRELVGEFVHDFSHIRRKIYVEFLSLHLEGGMHDLFKEDGIKTMDWKFLDGESVSSMGLTSAVRKVYSMVQKFKQNVSSSNSIQSRKRLKRS
ncbi:A/G-specific adenine DNA glycosylase [Hibiscus syriacus]|uniref:Adenine DNA glycosylase n=1 Tax=Hibiscus syriacus TaxID=106335 RepID=A0A6A3B7X6_HIBSY|nr:adenine DNA glycosylase-like [Hibiscus syriacus]KAE8713100.1 A/G-specific adenine DNA glycosylase [Hibiscus syriacus]